MKKKQKNNIIISIGVIVIIGAIISYNYSIDQTRQRGFDFGNQLQNIQDEVKQIQVEFNSKVTQWNEEDLSKEELLAYGERHVELFKETINKYDTLRPPEQFAPSVNLFKMSSQAQLQSDIEFIEWIKTGDEAYKIRSDSMIQESFEYEMAALSEYNAAKLGLK